MFDPPKHDGELNLKRERRRASAAGAHEGNARSQVSVVAGPLRRDTADTGVELYEVRPIEAEVQRDTVAEPDRQEPERNRPVLHLRKKDGVDAPLKKP
ncbi:hypothetical protein [Herbaspirillum sp. alder98]|uniref:hypothetical protein n=1 Tax=Herbaspirillum sp. alder98 TaxID=2913096 RepID=UPI001CD8EFF4|nr:hypothetical protein [Herbaspirillum sp. alder98]MCA1324774.1 hypothetical protein [Herbaspirillum sp. alder98]